MAQISHGTITITDITDIINLFFEYCLAQESVTAAELIDSNYFYTYFLTADTTYDVNKNYFSRQLIDGKYVYTTIVLNVGDNPQGYYERTINDEIEKDWSTTYPTWTQGYNIWTRQVQQREDVDELIYGTPFLDTTVNQISASVVAHTNNIDALNTKLKYFWDHLPDSTEPETSTYLYGTYMAAGINGVSLQTNNSNTYGYNSLLRHSAISFRYNDIDLTSIGQNGIFLYYTPAVEYNLSTDTTINNSKVYYEQVGSQFIPVSHPSGNPTSNNYYELNITAGNKGVELTTEGLNLYKPNNSIDKAIALTKDGLTIENGSIIIGTRTYQISNDTTVNNTKIYYQKNDTEYFPISNPSGNPHTKNYYELIQSGTSNTANGSIALTVYNFNRQINGADVDNLRFAIGDSFGVTESGQLYAYNAVIEGRILIGPGSGSNVYTKDETLSAQDISNTYLSNADAATHYLSNTKEVQQAQIIYKTIAVNVAIDTPNTWITETRDIQNNWTTIRPSYNTNYPNVYSAIQLQTVDGTVTTTPPSIDNGMTSILDSNGQVDLNKIDIGSIDIGQLGGTTLNSSVISNSNLATQSDLTATQNIIEHNIAGNYVSLASPTNKKWERLASRIDINPEGESPYIRIAANNDLSSFLNLQGDQINFVVNGQSGALLVTSDAIVTDKIRTTSIYMGADKNVSTLGWILRSNGHLSLKVLAQSE